MKKTLYLLLTLILSACVSQPVSTKSPLELQAIQSKEFETNKKVAFAATLSVFQDMGYIIESASFETGLVTSKSPTKQEYDWVWGGQIMKFVKATAFVEELAPNRTKVRVNLVNSKATSSAYGMKGEQDAPIETPDVYQDLFTKVQQGIFIRKNVQ